MAAEQSVELVFFSIDEVDFQSCQIQGKGFENGTWINRLTNFPKLIMNDCSTSPDRVKHLDKEKLLRLEVPFLSHLIEDKLSIYQRLEGSEDFSDLLIPSYPLRTLRDFSQIVRESPKSILKPTNSGKGQGIFVVTRKSEQSFIFQNGQNRSTYNRFFTQKMISDLCKKGNYMIQPYIPSLTLEGHVFHIRVHVMRNSKSVWTCGAVIADIAEKGWQISNYKGNKTIRAIDLLHQQFEKKGITMYNNIIQRSLKLAQHIDQFYPFMIDELAFDYGLDPDHNFRLFEANTGPEIITFAETREKERAKHRIGLAKTVVHALEKIPLEDRKGKHFKIH
ncbi:YheC/YheD family protein [Jeotgalibacillus aurantiacus]|uniref:YheC/YheD family protein n=1 Tax=Jeotgalibacillus aurantiacus TaxID=2763266 RepID=UPI001D0A4234|nr:YheC/YheD family protein [Jeotgalibacillus aurantiacus]